MSEELTMKGRVALITGASRGLGAAVAKKYASLGAHVILISRTVGGLEDIDDEIAEEGKGKATLIPFDLRKIDEIDQIAVGIAERFGKLDILVGNGAVLGAMRPVAQVTNKIWNNVMDTNFHANFKLIRALDPLLQKSDAGRAIFVTSGIVGAHRPFWGAYAISKAALEEMVLTYASEKANTDMRINLVDPGVLRTKMRAEAYPGEDAMQNPLPESIADMFVDLASVDCKKTGKIVKA